MTPKEAVDFAKKNNARIVDMKFMDLLGSWQHFSVPMCELEEHLFEEGLGFDGSSIRGHSRSGHHGHGPVYERRNG